jgi:hypothetical protein
MLRSSWGIVVQNPADLPAITAPITAPVTVVIPTAPIGSGVAVAILTLATVRATIVVSVIAWITTGGNCQQQKNGQKQAAYCRQDRIHGLGSLNDLHAFDHVALHLFNDDVLI